MNYSRSNVRHTSTQSLIYTFLYIFYPFATVLKKAVLNTAGLLDGTKLYSGRTQQNSQQPTAYLGLDMEYDE
jgi:hypothetical protein